jgi:glutamate/aspartate transport system substrate-binding protein
MIGSLRRSGAQPARRRALLALALACALVPAAGAAAPAGWADALSGGLKRIKETRTVRVGYREQAIPFSYLGADARPVGYTLDLCSAVVATLSDDLGVPLAIEYVAVTAQDRIARVESGAVDLECGATTNTAERRAKVAFSPAIFVTGTRLAIPRGSAIRDFRDLRGRTVAVVAGTTNEASMRELDRLNALGLALVPAGGYRDALALLDAGRADALAADEVLLLGLLAETGRKPDFRVVGGLLSFEAYGIVYSLGEPALGDAVLRTLRELAATREIVWIYNRWFERPLPGRQALGLPMAVPLRRSLELLGLPPD